MKTSLLLLAAGIALLGFTGCQNTVNTVENADKAASPSYAKDSRFVTDGFLRDRLKLKAVNMARTASGDLAVEVLATNVRVGTMSQIWSWFTEENPYPVDYRFTWQDENGMEVETTLSAWRRITIYPGETISLRSVAPSPRCKDFRLNLKESTK